MVLVLVLLAACAHRSPDPAPEALPVPPATALHLALDEAARAASAPGQDALAPFRAGLEAASPRVMACYGAAVKRNPRCHGEIIVRVEVRPEGGVRDVRTVLETVGDPDLVACVERAVQAADLPPAGEGGRVLDHPYVLTSDLTPPEVVRALRQRHGLDVEPDLGVVDRPPGSTPPGVVESW